MRPSRPTHTAHRHAGPARRRDPHDPHRGPASTTTAPRGYAWLRVATRGVANATGKRTPEAAFACVYGNGNGTRAHPRVELNRCVR